MLSGPNATSLSTVGMKSWSSGSWKIIPTRRLTSGIRSGVSGSSPIRTSPADGRRLPFRWRSSVDFPAPFAPTIPTDSPWTIRKETPSRAGVPSG